jgi:hypothetical protein
MYIPDLTIKDYVDRWNNNVRMYTLYKNQAIIEISFETNKSIGKSKGNMSPKDT